MSFESDGAIRRPGATEAAAKVRFLVKSEAKRS